MAADNELLVLIYENIQKTLNQMKDSRVVIQTLAARTGELEKTVKNMDARINEISDGINRHTEDLSARLDEVEKAVAKLTGTVYKKQSEAVSVNKLMTDTVNAMRGTIERVTNPAIVTISKTHMDTKEAVRELKEVHNRVMDEFEQYHIRLAQAEDVIEKLLTDQILPADAKKGDSADEQ